MEAMNDVINGDGIAALCAGWSGALLYDPPWDIEIPAFPIPREVIALCDGFRAADVVIRFGAPTWVFTWDCVSSWFTPNRPLRRAKYAFAYFDIDKCNPAAYRFGSAGKPRMVTNSRGTYAYVPDGEKMFSDVYSSPITKKRIHRHQKPVEWIAYLISTCTTLPILDPFCGSGSAAAACHMIGRKSTHYEIDVDTFNTATKWRDLVIPPAAKSTDLFS